MIFTTNRLGHRTHVFHGIRGIALLVLLTATSGCTRALQSTEKSFASSVFHENSRLDMEAIRLRKGGIINILSSSALVVEEVIHFKDSVYRDDFSEKSPRGWCSGCPLFAHELGHVWQYQNRRFTKYTIFKVLMEHLQHEKPYAYQPRPLDSVDIDFRSFRYEQQGKILQDGQSFAVGSETRRIYDEVIRKGLTVPDDAALTESTPPDPDADRRELEGLIDDALAKTAPNELSLEAAGDPEEVLWRVERARRAVQIRRVLEALE